MKSPQYEIEGLEWIEQPTVKNGPDSLISPLPTTDLVHIVFHGEEAFSHGRYGLHRGLEDRLMFLGSSKQVAKGFFVDCRKDSPTLHKKVVIEFTPSASKFLKIPCGVAHGFEGLEKVYTVNAYRAFLPPPEDLMTEKNPWATGTDILNFSYDCEDKDLPTVEINRFPASERFYEVLTEMQKATLPGIDYEFPHTEDFTESDGRKHTLIIKKKLSVFQQMPDWDPIPEISGLGWKRHLIVWSSESAGYSALTDYSPIQIIDHGENSYSTDAYGIHLEWEDRLTFLGPSSHVSKIKFIDCREQSPTSGNEVTITFSPSPLRMLVIPAGVAHAFESLETVFTLNRPVKIAGDETVFEPGNDVIDWPLDKRPAPVFSIGRTETSLGYYRQLVQAQRHFLAESTEKLSTPAILMVDDGHGKKVKVALRQNEASVS